MEASSQRPSERRIGVRVRVKGVHADEAAVLFKQNGFTPIYVEYRDDGDVSFWFAKALKDRFDRVAISIPRDFFAMQAFIGRITPRS